MYREEHQTSFKALLVLFIGGGIGAWAELGGITEEPFVFFILGLATGLAIMLTLIFSE